MRNIIDSHVHFWDPQKLRYAWLDSLPRLNRAFLADHVPPRVNDLHVDGIVFVQADCAPDEGMAEVEFVNGLAEHDARVRAIVAFAPLEDLARVAAHLEQLKQHALVKGVRRLIQDEAAGFCIRDDFIAGVRLLARYDFTFDLCIRNWQLRDAIHLVRACPNVRFVLDHGGKPNIREHVHEPWRTHISQLAALPNVSCKISGLVTEADHAAWTRDDVQPYIEHLLNAFGTDRVMFGSDAPVAYLATTYENWVETLEDATQEPADSDRVKLWYTNVRNFYRL